MHVILKAFRAKVLLFTIFSARMWKFVAYLVFTAMMARKILSGLAEIWVMKPRLWSSVGNRAEDGHLLKQGKPRKCLTRYKLVSAHIWHCPAATIMGQEFLLSVFACSPNIKFHKFCSRLSWITYLRTNNFQILQSFTHDSRTAKATRHVHDRQSAFKWLVCLMQEHVRTNTVIKPETRKINSNVCQVNPLNKCFRNPNIWIWNRWKTMKLGA